MRRTRRGVTTLTAFAARRASAARFMATLLGVLLCGLFFWSPLHAQSQTPPIVINEIHYNPDVDTEWVEFVELYNYGSVPVSLEGWRLSGAIRFEFPDNVTLGPRSWLIVAENVEAVRAKWGVPAVGAFQGRLSSDGERIELYDQRAALVDEVEYALGFPWPTVGDAPGNSIQLLKPSLDNAEPGAWRSALPTPATGNIGATANTPPLIRAVSQSPQSPRSDEPVVVTVDVSDSDGVQSVRLAFQVVRPGDYIDISNPRYGTQWSWVTLQQSDEDTWQVTLPRELQIHRGLVRYRIEATDAGGRRVAAPYADDPQPNFAYFVYNGLPYWPASITGSRENLTTFDFSQIRPLPVYHLIAKQSDVADALFMPNSAFAGGYMGDEYYWRGTLVYNGTVYDHISFRARGNFSRYATGKNMWKFDFPTGHHFQAYDDYGRPFANKREKLNLSAVIQQTHRKRRGEQGMFESMSYRLFDMAGVPSPQTNFVHFRVVDGHEYGGWQYWGDFWGLYLAVEQPDGEFLERAALPDGNLYKMETGGSNRNNLGRYGPADYSDVNTFMGTIRALNPSAQWWRDTVDLEGYYSYRAVLEFIHHYDVDQGKNYLYYSNPETRKWSVFPWDVDLTWFERMPGTGVEPFMDPVLSRPEFNLEYQNRLRALRDLLLNQEQIFAMLDEHAGWIDSPAWGNSMVDADRAMWDYHPIYLTRYVDPARTAPGLFYSGAPDRTFRGMVDLMKQYVAAREAWIDTTLLTDKEYPATPGLVYVGAAGFPVDQLRFSAGDFADPQGANTFAAMEWRIAEVTDPAASNYTIEAPRLYEIDSVWESGQLASFQRTLTPPLGSVQPGHAYRVRVRMKDNSGRWSHWSAPVHFVAGTPRGPLPEGLTLSEIMYHPLPEGNIPDEELEYIELQNTGGQPLRLDGVRIGGGIDYLFPQGTTLAPGAYLVLAKDKDAFQRRYRVAPFDDYANRLSNGGDLIQIDDPWERTLVRVEYGDDPPWPAEADGDGFSLVYNVAGGAPQSPAAWRRSNTLNGSPGLPEPQRVVINEVRLAPVNAMAVELHNTGDQPADVGRWFLGDSYADPRKVWLPAGMVIPPGGYLVLEAALLNTASFDGLLTLNPVAQNQLVLSAGDSGGNLTGYQHMVQMGTAEPGATFGRTEDSQGRELMVVQVQSTLGAANAGPRVGPVVISQVLYAPAGGPEYLELTNITDQPVKLYNPANPQQTWHLYGAFLSLPSGLELPPAGRLLVTAVNPDEACTLFAGNGLERVVGPFTRSLSNNGQSIMLMQPVGEWNGATLYAAADALEYRLQPPWPNAGPGQGLALRRLNLNALGNDPANWEASNLPPGSGFAPTATQLCSFGAQGLASGGAEISWTLASQGTITGFRLWRSTTPTRTGAVEVAQVNATAADAALDPAAVPTRYVVTDPAGDPSGPLYYWLDALGPEGTLDLGYTAPSQPFTHVFLPILARR